jgi:hypothetical protein
MFVPARGKITYTQAAGLQMAVWILPIFVL